MWHVGIDLHRATVVSSAVTDVGEAMSPTTIPCTLGERRNRNHKLFSVRPSPPTACPADRDQAVETSLNGRDQERRRGEAELSSRACVPNADCVTSAGSTFRQRWLSSRV